jgi:probable rRNA maturation factor
MNRTTVNAQGVPLPAWSDALESFAVKVMDYLGCKNWDLSLVISSDDFIRGLNAQYRKVDAPTDVLSFCLGAPAPDADFFERYLPGDIIISLETLPRNAAAFGVSQDEELRRLVIHGILHLSGLDHATNDAAEPMLVKQEEILRHFGGEHIYAPVS